MKAMSMSVELADGPVRTMDGLLGDAAQSNVAKLAQDVADLLSDWDSFLAQEEAETKRQQEVRANKHTGGCKTCVREAAWKT